MLNYNEIKFIYNMLRISVIVMVIVLICNILSGCTNPQPSSPYMYNNNIEQWRADGKTPEEMLGMMEELDKENND